MIVRVSITPTSQSVQIAQPIEAKIQVSPVDHCKQKELVVGTNLLVEFGGDLFEVLKSEKADR